MIRTLLQIKKRPNANVGPLSQQTPLGVGGKQYLCLFFDRGRDSCLKKRNREGEVAGNFHLR